MVTTQMTLPNKPTAELRTELCWVTVHYSIHWIPNKILLFCLFVCKVNITRESICQGWRHCFFLALSKTYLRFIFFSLQATKKAGITNNYKGYPGAICCERGDKRPEGTWGSSSTYKCSKENLTYCVLKNPKSWYRRNAGNHGMFIFQVQVWWEKETSRSKIPNHGFWELNICVKQEKRVIQ